jgi:hypothetical protein
VLAGCLAFSSPAWAIDECGAPPSVTCAGGYNTAGNVVIDHSGSINTDAQYSQGIRHEFLGEQEAEVSGLTFTHDLPGTMGFLATALEVEIIEDSLTLIVRGEFAKGSEGEEFTGSFGFNLTL